MLSSASQASSPPSPRKRSYLDEIVFLVWSLRRLDRTEVELFTYLHQNAYHTHADFPLGQPLVENPKAFNALTWRAISVRKALKEAFAAFYDLRDNPIPRAAPAPPPATETKQTALPEIGFEFSTSEFSTSHDTLSLASRDQPDDRFQE